jgi:hypothetical protein
MMLRDNPTGNGVELFILFKESDNERSKKTFASNAIHKQFEEVR